MRVLTGSVLLMFLLIITGCGKQNPAGAGGTRLTQLDEKHAANFLAAAKDFKQEGQPKHASNTLKELLNKYPESDAADEARQILAEIEKSDSDFQKSD